MSPPSFCCLLFSPGLFQDLLIRPLSTRWWAGSALGLSSVLCLASGALTLVSIIVLRTLQLFLSVRGGWREWAGIAIQLAAIAIAVMTTPASVPSPATTHTI